jgi:hypothetical protein
MRPRRRLTLTRQSAQAQAAEARRRGLGEQDRAPRLEADGHRRKLRREIRVRHSGKRGPEIGQTRGAPYLQPGWAGAGPCKVKSRWCDRSIQDASHAVDPIGPKGRWRVWNARRGNHLGQPSGAIAYIGRTYERKRSDQNAAQNPCEEEAVHIWGPDADRRDNPLNSTGRVTQRRRFTFNWRACPCKERLIAHLCFIIHTSASLPRAVAFVRAPTAIASGVRDGRVGVRP